MTTRPCGKIDYLRPKEGEGQDGALFDSKRDNVDNNVNKRHGVQGQVDSGQQAGEEECCQRKGMLSVLVVKTAPRFIKGSGGGDGVFCHLEGRWDRMAENFAD